MSPYLEIIESTRDEALEERILSAHTAFMAANNRGDGKAAGKLWREFVALVAQRSPAKVEQMEQEKGLR